jgi:hypothetical protein
MAFGSAQNIAVAVVELSVMIQKKSFVQDYIVKQK